MDHTPTSSSPPSLAYIYTTAPQAVLLLCFNNVISKKSGHNNDLLEGEVSGGDGEEEEEELHPDGNNNNGSMTVDELCVWTGLTLNETQRLILSLTHPSAPLLRQISSPSTSLGGMDEEDGSIHQSRSPSPSPVPSPAFYSTPPRVSRSMAL